MEYGEQEGLRGQHLEWFASLFLWPISVVDGEWVDGRHRARSLHRAGATHVAAEDPAWVPEWARDNES